MKTVFMVAGLCSSVLAGVQCWTQETCKHGCQETNGICGCATTQPEDDNDKEWSPREKYQEVVCYGGKPVTAYFGNAETHCEGAPITTLPLKVCAPEYLHFYKRRDCVGIADGKTPKESRHVGKGCTEEAVEGSESPGGGEPFCSCTDGARDNGCGKTGCADTELCVPDACTLGRDNTCELTGDTCSCPTGYVRTNNICVGGKPGKAYYEGSSCSGQPTVHEPDEPEGNENDYCYEENKGVTMGSATYTCEGVADGSTINYVWYNTSSDCTGEIAIRVPNMLVECRCDSAPYVQAAGCAAAQSKIEGCNKDGVPVADFCTAGDCVADAAAYSALSCEYGDYAARWIATCDAATKQAQGLSTLEVYEGDDCAKPLKVFRDGQFSALSVIKNAPTYDGSDLQKLECTSATTAIWKTCSDITCATPASAVPVAHGKCFLHASGTASLKAVLTCDTTFVAADAPKEAVVIPSATVTISSATALTTAQQTSTKDAYCQATADATKIPVASLTCNIVAKAGRRLLAVTYTMSAWTSPVAAATATAVPATFADTVTTKTSEASGVTTTATSEPGAAVTKPAGADQKVVDPVVDPPAGGSTGGAEFSGASSASSSLLVCASLAGLAILVL